MTKATETLLASALRLDLKERAALASELLASLDGPADPDAASAWSVESHAESLPWNPGPSSSNPGKTSKGESNAMSLSGEPSSSQPSDRTRRTRRGDLLVRRTAERTGRRAIQLHRRSDRTHKCLGRRPLQLRVGGLPGSDRLRDYVPAFPRTGLAEK